MELAVLSTRIVAPKAATAMGVRGQKSYQLAGTRIEAMVQFTVSQNLAFVPESYCILLGDM